MKFLEKDPRRCPVPGGRYFVSEDQKATVLISEDNGLMHLSISRHDRYPEWDEIKNAVYTLLPEEKTYAMYFPPKSQFVNIHPNCFHVYEVKE